MSEINDQDADFNRLNFESYWNLINAIRELCEDAIDSEYLFADDIYSALDRAKFYILSEHTEFRMENRLADAGILMRDYEEVVRDDKLPEKKEN